MEDLKPFLQQLAKDGPGAFEDDGIDEKMIRNHPTLRAFIDNAITIKEALFIERFLANNFNATEAATFAGYPNPSSSGYMLKKRKKCRLLIAERLTKLTMKADEVLARWKEMASATFDDFLHVYDDGEVRVDLSRAQKRGKMSLLKKIKKKKDGAFEIELIDQSKALDSIARHLNMFKSEMESAGDNATWNRIMAMSPDERDEEMHRLRMLEKDWREDPDAEDDEI